MSSGSSSYVNGHGSGTSSGGNNIVGVGGALSFMGCVREASPPPHDHHHHHHTLVMDYMDVDRPNNSLVKEPKKRRFHPLRGLRKIFRRKSRNAIDTEMITEIHEHSNDTMMCNKDELNVRHSDKRMEEIRSKSASELLKETCDRQSIFLRRSGVNETLSKRRGNSGQLSISHDSIFHGEVPHTRPLSSLDTLTPLERRHGKANDESAHNDYNSRAFFNHRISLRVIEQIKTAIENRHHVTLAECSNTSRTSRDCYQQEPTENFFTRGDKRDRIEELNEERCEIEENKEQIWRTTQTLHQDAVDKKISPKAELPELESVSLNHTAAHHRISVRPKNRRPPRRTVTTTTNISCSIPCSTITTISECTDTVDSLEAGSSNNGSNSSTPVEMKSVSIIRKSSSCLSRTSDNSDETIETKLPNIPANVVSVSPDSLDLSPIKLMSDNYETDDDHEVKCVVRKSSNRISKNLNDELDISDVKISRNFITVSNKFIKSSDNIVNSFSNLSDSLNKSIDNKDVGPTLGKIQNFMSKSTDGFNLFTEQLEVKSIPKKIISKSTEAFDTVDETEIPLTRGKYNYMNQLTDISHAVSKSSDSLEVVEMTAASDDSIEHRRSSFEIRPRRNIKAISMSSDNFDTLEKSQQFNKRNSITDVHLSGVTRHSRMTNKIISKSIESFDTTAVNLNERKYSNSLSVDKNYWKISCRTINSDNSKNIEINDDHVENRKIQKPSKIINNSNTLDVPSENNIYTDDNKKPMVMKKLLSSRYRKSSDSSELDSNDTLDLVKQKLSDSTETIDSLEKDSDNNLTKDKYNKNNTSPMTTSENESDISNANDTNNKNHEVNVENKMSAISPDKSYWRQRSDSKENIDIHQLLAITIVSRISDNSNNQRNSGSFPKNKIISSPTSPIVKQDGNKLLFNNLIVNNNDEELQNMLNGNISEVSIDTKSFKEKLIMFEKLGK